jgi:hypothetical protein
LNAVDVKGRLSVPAFIRQKIERRSDEKVLVLSLHPEFQCLVGYDSNHSGVMYDRAEARLGDNPDPFAELDMQAGIFGSQRDRPVDAVQRRFGLAILLQRGRQPAMRLRILRVRCHQCPGCGQGFGGRVAAQGLD